MNIFTKTMAIMRGTICFLWPIAVIFSKYLSPRHHQFLRRPSHRHIQQPGVFVPLFFLLLHDPHAGDGHQGEFQALAAVHGEHLYRVFVRGEGGFFVEGVGDAFGGKHVHHRFAHLGVVVVDHRHVVPGDAGLVGGF